MSGAGTAMRAFPAHVCVSVDMPLHMCSSLTVEFLPDVQLWLRVLRGEVVDTKENLSWASVS